MLNYVREGMNSAGLYAAAIPMAVAGGIALLYVPAGLKALDAFNKTKVGRAFNLFGTVDGLRNAASDNGIKKTVNFVKEGNVKRALLSGLGDVFDITGGAGYLKGVSARGAESVLRMGDASLTIGNSTKKSILDIKKALRNLMDKNRTLSKEEIFRKLLISLNTNIGGSEFFNLYGKSYLFRPKKLILSWEVDENALKTWGYILGLNDDWAYHMPLKYAGTHPGIGRTGRNRGIGITAHKGDVIDLFLRKTEPSWTLEEVPYPIRSWFRTHYPDVSPRVAAPTYFYGSPVTEPISDLPYIFEKKYIKNATRDNMGTFTCRTGVNSPSLSSINPKTFINEAVLDPGGYNFYGSVKDGALLGEGYDVYKYLSSDYVPKYLLGSDDFHKKLKSLGLKWLDSKGTPIVYHWKTNSKSILDILSNIDIEHPEYGRFLPSPDILQAAKDFLDLVFRKDQGHNIVIPDYLLDLIPSLKSVNN